MAYRRLRMTAGRRLVFVQGLMALTFACRAGGAPEGTMDPSTPQASVRVPDVSAQPWPEDSRPFEPEIDGYTPEVAQWLGQAQVRARRDPGMVVITIARRGTVRYSPDGAGRGIGDLAPLPDTRPLWVVEDGPRPRVVTDDPDVRLLLYVDRADAQPVVVKRAPLRPAADTPADGPPKRGYAVLHPGARVDVVASDGDAVQVEYGHGSIKHSGWVAASRIGTTAADEAPVPSDRVERLATTTATPLRDRPRGAAMVELQQHVLVTVLDPSPVRGHVLVEYQGVCELDLSFVGFVARRALAEPRFGSGSSCASGRPRIVRLWGDAQSAPRVAVEAGRFLLDVDGANVVGCALRRTEVADLGDGRYAVPTSWGPLPVRLAPPELEGACGTKR